MNNQDFWASIDQVISDGFAPEGLSLLDKYGEQFISGKLIYKRFSPSEQHGCAAGGTTHVIASLLAAASFGSDSLTAPIGSFKREQQLAAAQESHIEQWAKASCCWIDDVDKILVSHTHQHHRPQLRRYKTPNHRSQIPITCVLLKGVELFLWFGCYYCYGKGY